MIGNFLQTVGSRKGRCGAKSELCPTGDDFFVIVFGDSFFGAKSELCPTGESFFFR